MYFEVLGDRTHTLIEKGFLERRLLLSRIPKWLIIMSFPILYIWSNVAAKCKFMSCIFIKFEDMVHEAKKATFFFVHYPKPKVLRLLEICILIPLWKLEILFMHLSPAHYARSIDFSFDDAEITKIWFYFHKLSVSKSTMVDVVNC